MLHNPGDAAFHHTMNGHTAMPAREREARGCLYLCVPNTTHLSCKGGRKDNRSWQWRRQKSKQQLRHFTRGTITPPSTQNNFKQKLPFRCLQGVHGLWVTAWKTRDRVKQNCKGLLQPGGEETCRHETKEKINLCAQSGHCSNPALILESVGATMLCVCTCLCTQWCLQRSNNNSLWDVSI